MIWRKRRSEYGAWVRRRLVRSHALDWENRYPLHILAEVEGGAVLAWTFDFDPITHDSSTLCLFLTNGEAKRVVKADRLRVGMLEPVRKELKHRDAYLIVEDGKEREFHGAQRFVISPDGDEKHFVSGLDHAAEAIREAPRMALPPEEIEFAREVKLSASMLERLIPINSLAMQ